MPTERGGPEPRRLLAEDEKRELERLGQPDVRQLYGRGPGGEEILVVERAMREAHQPLTRRRPPDEEAGACEAPDPGE